MTVTDTPPAVADATAEPAAPASMLARVAGVLTTGEHKMVGRLFIVSSLGFALFTLVMGVLFELEQTDLGGLDIVGGREAYVQLFGLWRTGLVFLVVVPLFLGIATAVVPLQVGAPSIAFPRAAAAAFWAWLLAGGLYIGGTFADGGFNAGGDSDAIELTIVAFMAMLAALMLSSVCVITTVIAQRAEGMSLTRVPMFSWTMLVSGALWLLTLPVLIANLMLMWVDLRGNVVLFFETGESAPGALRYVSWALDQPQVFLYALPLLGVLAELVPVAARVRQSMRTVVMGAVAAFGVFSVGAYAQPVYNERVASQPVFVVQNLLLLLPLLVVLGALAFTIKSGKPKGSLALAIASGSMLMLLAAGLVGALRVFGRFIGGLRELDDWNWVDNVAEPFDDLAGTAIVAGQFRYVLFAGLIGAVAGLYYWAPKIFGRTLNPAFGGLAALALVGGTVLSSLPQVVNGFLDEPDVAASASARSGVEALNWISTAGLAVVALGVLAVLGDLAMAGLKSGDDVADDPWGGQTLEWSTPSPPPRGNFAAAVTVDSDTPLLDTAEGAD